MAEVSLRGYIQDIDELIEREKLDEAIAHCRHILQTYPKHLDTYRLLGKAYLEAKRYGDAADIFQRVLSAVPDDFVSHIGMAIVREDEGNLDASIWHMERAFETNPANPAIQQELRRLIGRRDGLEPHKVRLTRGALARMYAHGELFQQAITELRSALQEDPERPDLQVLLADMYWRTGQQNEAVAVSSRVLEKLPNCLEANRVLAASLRGKERIEEAAVYHRRLAGLDPYASFLESPEADPQGVEAIAVALTKLEWKTGQPIPSVRAEQPGWAATLGMELQERRAEEAQQSVSRPGTGPLPSWLEPGEPPPFLEGDAEPQSSKEAMWQGPEPSGYEEPSPTPEGGVPDEMAAVQPSGDDIPSWMREAGWGESAGEAIDRPISFTDEELGALAAGQLPPVSAPRAEDDLRDLTPAQLPDWIRDIAPSQQELGAEPIEPSIPEAEPPRAPSWLQQVEPMGEEGSPAEELAKLMAGTPASPERSGEGLPFGQEVMADSPIEAAWEPEAAVESPVAGREAEPIVSDVDSREWPTWIADEAPGATDTIVTWLDSQGRKPAPAEREEVPDWMSDIPAATEEPSPLAEATGLEASKEVTPARGIGRKPAEEPAVPARATSEPGAPGWLAAVAEAAAREDSRPEPMAPPLKEPVEAHAEAVQAQAAEEPPDWISQLAQTEEEAPEAGSEAELPKEAPSWLPEPVTPEQPRAASVPEWAMEAEQPVEEQPARPAARADVPEWLQGLAESVRGSEPAAAPEWPETIAEVPSTPAPAGGSDTPDWLRGLAGEGPPTAPSAPAVDAPDWLRGLGEPGTEGEEPAPAQAEVPDWLRPAGEEVPAGVDSRTPNWLSGLGEEQPEATTMAEPELPYPEEQAAGWQTPDWLEAAQADTADRKPEAMDFQPAAAEEQLEQTPELAPADEMDDEQVMGWLEDLAAKQTEPRAEEPEEEQTKWLEITFGEPSAEPLMGERRLPEEPEEGLEWLERLAEQRGLDIDVGSETPTPEAVEAPAEPEPEEPAQAPGWLQRMASAPTIPLPRPDADQWEVPPIEVPAPGDETLPGGSALQQGPRPGEERAPEAEEVPAWQPAPPTAEQPPREPEEEVPEWLASFAADWTPAPRPVETEEPVTTFPGAEAPRAEPALPTPPSVEIAPPPTPPQPAAVATPIPTPPVQAAPPPTQPQPVAGATPTPTPPVQAAPPPTPLPEPVVPPAPVVAAPTPILPLVPPAKRALDDAELLDLSRLALASGDFAGAAKSYGQLIKGRRSLDKVIADLQIALDRSPENAALWQCIGDAYMKADQVSEAIDAYRRGMESA
jgi:tetratricopeptide (TPR) repeat protein